MKKGLSHADIWWKKFKHREQWGIRQIDKRRSHGQEHTGPAMEKTVCFILREMGSSWGEDRGTEEGHDLICILDGSSWLLGKE